LHRRGGRLVRRHHDRPNHNFSSNSILLTKIYGTVGGAGQTYFDSAPTSPRADSGGRLRPLLPGRRPLYPPNHFQLRSHTFRALAFTSAVDSSFTAPPCMIHVGVEYFQRFEVAHACIAADAAGANSIGGPALRTVLGPRQPIGTRREALPVPVRNELTSARRGSPTRRHSGLQRNHQFALLQ